MTCTLCNVKLDESNKTEEHVIPNALGGRKKVVNFICDDCNNKTGEKWDAELAKQLSHFSLLLGISRERGDPPAQVFSTIDGSKIKVLSNGELQKTRPVVEHTVNESGISVHIRATDLKEAKKHLQGKVRSLKKQYPTLSGELNTEIPFTPSKEYMDSPLHIESSFGGNDAGRSIVKTALAMVFASGINPKICEHAIQYLLHDGEPCFGYYFDKDPISNRLKGLPIHCVHVQGNSTNNLITAYIEYYGHMRIALKLSSSYTGKSFNNTYCFNPLTGETIDTIINFPLTEREIEKCYNYEYYNTDVLKSALGDVMVTLRERDFARQLDRETSEALEQALNELNMGIDDDLTDEQLKILVNLMTNKMMPFLVRHVFPHE